MIIIETCPKCGHDLTDVVIATYPPIPKKECFNCGWSWEGEREEVVRVPFGGNTTNTTEYSLLNDFNKVENFNDCNTESYTFNELSNSLIRDNFSNEACNSCSSNPKNGGTGICFCTVGQMNVAY